MKKTTELIHPTGERFLHWIHALLVLFLTLTGLSLLYRKAVLFSLPDMRRIHQVLGITTAFFYIAWILYGLRKRRIKSWFPNKKGFLQEAAAQFRWYIIGVFKGEEPPHIPAPEDRLNPLQKLVYPTVMIVFMPVQFLTGLAMLLEFGLSSALVVNLHVLISFLIVLFLLLHFYLCIFAPPTGSYLMSMIKGTFYSD